MRSSLRLVVITALLVLCGVRLGNANLNESQSWFESMDVAKRLQLQQDLHWTGDYKGKVDGTFGQETYSAITAFQQRRNLEPDGKLKSEELAALSSEAGRIRQLVRYYATKEPKISTPPARKKRAQKVSVVRKTYLPVAPRLIGPSFSWVLILP